MQELNIAMDTLIAAQPLVGLWMNWMGFISLISIFFVWKHIPARLALGAFILIMPIGFLIFKSSGNLHLMGLSHIIVWFPLAIYIGVRKTKDITYKSPYGIWLGLFFSTIVISLLFDFRDIVLVMMGIK